MHMIRGSGHWTQQEKPAKLSHLLVDRLACRFR